MIVNCLQCTEFGFGIHTVHSVKDWLQYELSWVEFRVVSPDRMIWQLVAGWWFSSIRGHPVPGHYRNPVFWSWAKLKMSKRTHNPRDIMSQFCAADLFYVLFRRRSRDLVGRRGRWGSTCTRWSTSRLRWSSPTPPTCWQRLFLGFNSLYRISKDYRL